MHILLLINVLTILICVQFLFKERLEGTEMLRLYTGCELLGLGGVNRKQNKNMHCLMGERDVFAVIVLDIL